MNFFEQELRKIFKNIEIEAKYLGRKCMGDLGNGKTFKTEFVTTGNHEKYPASRIEVLGNDRKIDSSLLMIDEVIGKKQSVVGLMSPYIWKYNDIYEWYAYEPNSVDYKSLGKCVGDYLDFFKDQTHTINNLQRKAEILENGISAMFDLYEGNDLFEMLHHSFGMTEDEIHDAGFKMPDVSNSQIKI